MKRHHRWLPIIALALAACAQPAQSPELSSPPPSDARPSASQPPRSASPSGALRADFGFTHLDRVPDGQHRGPSGMTLYRYRLDFELRPGDPATWDLRLPPECRRDRPHNCPWQLTPGSDPPVLELYVVDVRDGAYTITLVLPDGRTASAALVIVAATAAASAAPQPQSTRAPSAATPTGVPPARTTAATAVPTAPTRTSAPLPPLATPVPRAAPPAGALRLLHDFAGPDSRHSSSGVADASVAAGLGEVIVATNDVAAIFTKDGTLLDLRQLPDLFRAYVDESEWVGDARVTFDHRSARYFLTISTTPRGVRCQPFSECANKWLLAVSKDSRPRQLDPSSWHVYGFDGRYENGQRAQTFGDFTVTASTDSLVVLSGQVTDAAGTSYAKIWTFDKEELLRGAPVAAPAKDHARVRAPSGAVIVRALPAVLFGDTSTVFLASWSPGLCSVTVVGVGGTARESSVVVRDAVAPGTCSAPPSAIQPGSATLDVATSVTSAPFFRDGRLWVTHSVGRNTSDGPVNEIRLVEIDLRGWPADPTVLSDVRYGEEAAALTYPAVAVSAAGDVALVAARSTAVDYPSVYFTGRRATDPAGALRPAALLRAGVAPKNCSDSVTGRQTRNRFADFSGAAIDPVDGTAWIVAEYATGADRCNWGSWVGRVDWGAAP